MRTLSIALICAPLCGLGFLVLPFGLISAGNEHRNSTLKTLGSVGIGLVVVGVLLIAACGFTFSAMMTSTSQVGAKPPDDAFVFLMVTYGLIFLLSISIHLIGGAAFLILRRLYESYPAIFSLCLAIAIILFGGAPMVFCGIFYFIIPVTLSVLGSLLLVELGKIPGHQTQM